MDDQAVRTFMTFGGSEPRRLRRPREVQLAQSLAVVRQRLAQARDVARRRRRSLGVRRDQRRCVWLSVSRLLGVGIEFNLTPKKLPASSESSWVRGLMGHGQDDRRFVLENEEQCKRKPFCQSASEVAVNQRELQRHGSDALDCGVHDGEELDTEARAPLFIRSERVEEIGLGLGAYPELDHLLSGQACANLGPGRPSFAVSVVGVEALVENLALAVG